MATRRGAQKAVEMRRSDSMPVRYTGIRRQAMAATRYRRSSSGCLQVSSPAYPSSSSFEAAMPRLPMRNMRRPAEQRQHEAAAPPVTSLR